METKKKNEEYVRKCEIELKRLWLDVGMIADMPIVYKFKNKMGMEFNTAKIEYSEELLCQAEGIPPSIAIPDFHFENSVYHKTCTIKIELSMKCADAIAFNLRSIKTNEAYYTFGGITDAESIGKFTKPWRLKKWYKKVIKSISKRFDVPLNLVTLCDQSFRMKRCRGSCDVYNVGVGGLRTLVLFVSQVDRCATWFDVAFSTTNLAAMRHVLEKPFDSARRQSKGQMIVAERDNMIKPRWPKICHICGMPDSKENRIQRCDRCKIRGFCSRDCQIRDWCSHKKVCVVKD